MIQLFGDYREIVVADYFRKKEANTISPRLARPTPALLKEASIAKCSKGIDKKDYENLMVFFEKARDVNALPNAIEKCDIDKFRPLVNLLKKKTKETEDKNVELLAWLIDYPDRPYEYGKSYRDFWARTNGTEKETGKEKGIEDAQDGDYEAKNNKNKGIEETLQSPESNTQTKKITEAGRTPLKQKWAFRIIAATIILAVIAVTAVALFWPKSKRAQVFALTGKESCMFWTGDHYEQVSCNQKLDDTLIIALDSVKLNHFKKITLPDTITSNAIGSVWYVKLNGNIEFYTADGYHPVHRDLRLRPVTAYIINKYVRSGGHPE